MCAWKMRNLQLQAITQKAIGHNFRNSNIYKDLQDLRSNMDK